MTQEDKRTLLTVLCMELPYGVKLDNGLELRSIDVLTKVVSCSGSDRKIDYVRPYLRPMSSMTEEEKLDYIALGDIKRYTNPQYAYLISEQLDYLNTHHFDYHGLIEKGLALEAPEGMYK